MKIIAFYLPQFHSIPENDIWWGKGFTEWTNVKNAKKLFEEHYQPRIPLNNNYYNLTDSNTLMWQVEMAKKYNVYGFCFYHYWFDGHMLLQKPMEIMYENDKINYPYCICWANENWTNAWKADGDVKTLIQQTYGEKKDWKDHFDYLLKFFKDPNYIKNNNKPFFVIYRPEIIPCLKDMLEYWKELSIENGFNGIDFAYQQISFDLMNDNCKDLFEYNIEYQPTYARYDLRMNDDNNFKKIGFMFRELIRKSVLKIDKILGSNLYSKISRKKLMIEDYDDLCNCIISRKPSDKKAIPGMFVGWDNTSRRGIGGSVCVGSTPEKFKRYLSLQIQNAKINYNKDMIFMFAWNEWAEGGYLEPDEKYKYGYLEAIKSALEENK